jgi:hypothetical protein
MFIENILLSVLANFTTFVTRCNGRPEHSETPANARVCRKLPKTYLKSSKVNVLPSGRNSIVALPAALVATFLKVSAGSWRLPEDATIGTQTIDANRIDNSVTMLLVPL